MKYSFIKAAILFLILFSFGLIKAQPTFVWAKQYQSNILAYSKIAHDKSGNIYTTGVFTGTVDFDPGPDTLNMTSIGMYSNYIWKLDSAGNFVWVKQVKGNESNYAEIAIDVFGDIIITGEFMDTVDFDPGPAMFNMVAAGYRNIYILKLNANGSFIWAKQLKGGRNPNMFATGLAIDTLGLISICGVFSDTVDFDPGVNDYKLIGKSKNIFISNWNVFILKLNGQGNFIWAKQLGGDATITSYSIALDTGGNPVIIGNFDNTIDFDPGLDSTILISQSVNDVFILKLTKDGNFSWVKQISGTMDKIAMSMIIDSSGNINITGCFRGTVDFDPGPSSYLITQSNSTNTSHDVFIAKYNQNGNYIWAKQIGGIFGQQIINSTIDKFKNIYIAGSFWGLADFDPSNAKHELTPIDPSDSYIAKYDSFGNFKWVKLISGFNDDMIHSILWRKNELYITGDISGKVDFDPSDSVYNLPDTASHPFIVKWNICNSYSSITAGLCDSFVFNNQTYQTSGKFTQVISNYNGCDSIISLTLSIIKKPVAKFSSEIQTGCQYVAYTFIDSSFSDTVGFAGYSYRWDFGDGNTSTINSPTRIASFKHTYTQSGIFTVQLIFSNGFCSDSFTMFNKVIILPAPKPGFSMNARFGCIPFNLNIKDTLTTDIILKEYDFGNGFIALKNNQPFDTILPINIPGNYIYRQRLTGSTGCITHWQDTLIIKSSLTILDTVKVLYTTVLDSTTTLTKWLSLNHAASYQINNKITTDTFFKDINVKPYLDSIQYFVSAIDSCGNKSADAPVAQTIYLKGENQNFNEFALLQYTPYETWVQGVMQYQIEYFNTNLSNWTKLNTKPGNILFSNSNVLPDTINYNTSNLQICYRVIAIEKNGNKQMSASNVVCLPIYPIVFLPNAFSPNGDGTNDYFKPVAAGLNAYIFEIYDRWGTLVYTDTPDSKGWDGTFRGEPATEGAYVFRLSAAGYLLSPATNEARRVERKGTLFLVR